MYDAAIIGGGPAGAAAAKCLAESGLSTVMLEKRSLPREKICSGFVMDSWPLMRRLFGEIPADVLCAEGQLNGITLHVPGAGSHLIAYTMPTAWRSTLDNWLVQRAVESGAELRQETRLLGLTEEAEGYALRVGVGEREETLQARYVVGADGTKSVVRALLWPEVKTVYSQGVQETYATSVDLARDEWHVFIGTEIAPFFFDVHFKDGLLLLECGCRLGATRTVMGWGRSVLSEQNGLDAGQSPTRRGACTEPVLYPELFAGRFQPARGNALLVGDAAGFIMPVSGEGMLGAVRSGQLAAEAILTSSKSGQPASEQYLSSVQDTVEQLKAAFTRVRAIRKAAEGGADQLLDALVRSWEETLMRR